MSAHSTILIGYLPVSKLECFQKKTRSIAGYRLFHYAMTLLLCPLVDAVSSPPILAAYIADFPEQCLVACNKENCCPCCLVELQNCGDLEECVCCSMVDMLKTLRRKRRNKQSRKFNKEGLRPVFEPFWKDLPYTDIFICITPDILHQFHKGIFHDHLVQWCLGILSSPGLLR